LLSRREFFFAVPIPPICIWDDIAPKREKTTKN